MMLNVLVDSFLSESKNVEMKGLKSTVDVAIMTGAGVAAIEYT